MSDFFEELDPEKVKQLERAWAEQETWFQLDRTKPDEQSLRVPGSWEAAIEGEEAYYMYRDAFVPWMEWLQGTDDVLAELVRLYSAAAARDPEAIGQVAQTLFDESPTFRKQWHNLFGNPYWPGVTHESLAHYARKFEVEWPLLLITALTEIVSSRGLDLSQKRFRDRGGRLLKGKLVAHLVSELRGYPALSKAVESGYDARLRNIISHNSYAIANGKVTSIDGSIRRSGEELYRQVQLLQSVQNGLLWLKNAVTRSRDVALHSKGVVVVGWLPMTDTTPRAIVGQLEPFHALDADAKWLDAAHIWFENDKMMTRFGAARARGGQLFDALNGVIEAIRTNGTLTIELFPVMPCLHLDSFDHLTLPTSRHVYCPTGEPLIREIPARVDEKT